MSRNGVPANSNALQRLAELADKAAGYPAEAVFLGTGQPSGVFTLRAAEPIEEEDGTIVYPVTEELERVLSRGAQRLTPSERSELEQHVAQARPIREPQTPNPPPPRDRDPNPPPRGPKDRT